MKYFLFITLAIAVHYVSLSNIRYCSTDYAVIKWNRETKNRITKVKIKDGVFDFRNVKLPQDSLTYFFTSLIPSKDTLFNIRMYCVLKCGGKRDELYIEWSGLIEYNGICYQRDDELTRFFLNHLPIENKKDYWPSWLQ